MRNVAAIIFVALFLVSCVARPERLDSGSVSNFAEDKLKRVTAGQEPIVHPITLYEAMARAIKYNLDFHVELYNEALESKQLVNANLAMLPEIVANSAYNGRNNYAGGSTASLRSDKSRYNGDFALSWNILDFGLSYVHAKQAADRVMIAEERRRKIINRVIEDVRTAYWRAVSADRLIAGLRRLVVRVRRAIRDSEALQKNGVSSPLTSLTYQRELVEIQQRILSLQADLSVAKTQLAALMNIPPNKNYKLAPGKVRIGLRKLKMSADEMIFTAMQNRPEIRDVQYNMRINQKEAKVALLELLPSANIFAGANVDTDSFLLNGNWVGWGAKATWNLMKVFKYPARKQLIAAKDELLDKRALAITMAIMTQVHVSRARYANNRNLYYTAAKHLRIQSGILHQIRESAAADQASEQTLIREEMNTLVSRAKRDVAYADLQNSYANIYSAMGLDPYTIKAISNDRLSSIASSLKEMWIERGVRSGGIRVGRKLKRNQKAASSSHGNDQLSKTTVKSSQRRVLKKINPVEDPITLDKVRFGNNANGADKKNDRDTGINATQTITANSLSKIEVTGAVVIKEIDRASSTSRIHKKKVYKRKIKKPIKMGSRIGLKSVPTIPKSQPLAMLRNTVGN